MTREPDKRADGVSGAVVLVGAGRHGHNLIGLLEDAGLCIARVLDDNVSGTILGYRIAPLAGYAGPVWNAYLAVGRPETRRSLVERLSPAGFCWPVFADRRAVISRHAVLKPGSFVGPLSALADAHLGPHASIIAQCVIGAQVRIGAFSTIAPHVTIGSGAQIGLSCLISMGARIAAGVTIGDGCQIGPNAVVRRDVPSGSIVVAENRVRVAKRWT